MSTIHLKTDPAVVARAEHESRERYLGALSGLVSGGLYICEDESPGEAERAMLRTCGALLKAVTVATFVDCDSEQLSADDWAAHSSVLTKTEQHEALCAIVSMLENAPRVLAELRSSGDFRQGHERPDSIEAAREARTRLAGEQAIAEEDAERSGVRQ